MLRRRLQAFGFAIRGIQILIAGEPHARFHLLATISVVGLTAWCRVEPSDWAILFLAIGMVWTAEALNSAVERLSDRVTLDKDPRIRDAKDLAAGAVLLASLAAAGTGLWVLVPAVLARLGQ